MRLYRSILLGVVLLVASCGPSEQLAKVVAVDPAGWFESSEITFEVSDTTRLQQMAILLRHDNYVSVDTVELLVSTTAPDGVRWSEDFALCTTHSHKPLQVAEATYRTNIKWQQLGQYRVTLHPKAIYKGITTVGIHVKDQK